MLTWNYSKLFYIQFPDFHFSSPYQVQTADGNQSKASVNIISLFQSTSYAASSSAHSDHKVNPLAPIARQFINREAEEKR